jgi:citrate synthase
MEMISDKKKLTARPRKLYVGPAQRDYIPIEQR